MGSGETRTSVAEFPQDSHQAQGVGGSSTPKPTADGGSSGGDGDGDADLLPVRMLNEYAYCPRLFYLMHVEGRWEDNAYTIEGQHVHRRVDEREHVLPE